MNSSKRFCDLPFTDATGLIVSLGHIYSLNVIQLNARIAFVFQWYFENLLRSQIRIILVYG